MMRLKKIYLTAKEADEDTKQNFKMMFDLCMAVN